MRVSVGTFVVFLRGRRIVRVEVSRARRRVAAPPELRRAFERALRGLPLRGWSLACTASRLERAVWRQLRRIPYGATVSYGDVARRAGYPQAVRAVASAIGRNPLLVLVPCHRVVRKDGNLGGYAGPLAVKRALLALERAVLRERRRPSRRRV